ncbi:hypothetical protein HPB49_015328 [Dermacentor silvarum]|uniref:Uncharacterized protein n=1 Tax=Dermacentor silvarum TaxID=543639 RepID=A0ACB8CFY7_DERSI|nr:hypothetical protein HPB49_015328 [Dermacentor silvarum]
MQAKEEDAPSLPQHGPHGVAATGLYAQPVQPTALGAAYPAGSVQPDLANAYCPLPPLPVPDAVCLPSNQGFYAPAPLPGLSRAASAPGAALPADVPDEQWGVDAAAGLVVPDFDRPQKDEPRGRLAGVTPERGSGPDWLFCLFVTLAMLLLILAALVYLTYRKALRFCGSSSLKIAAENQWFSSSGSESSPQPPPHQSQAFGSCSMSPFSTIHSEPGSNASKTVDEAALVAASAREACGDDAGDVQYCDLWDTGPATVALQLLRAENQRKKSPTPAQATPAEGRASSADEMARQRHIYEAAFDLSVKQRVPDQGLDQMAQSPVLHLPGLQQQLRAGPLHPVSSSSSSSGVSVIPGRKRGTTRQPSLQDACYPKPPPHQGSSCSTSASSSVQQQPAPTPRGSSSSGCGKFPFLLPCSGQGLAFKQASVADKSIYQNLPLPRSPISENPPPPPPVAPIGAVAIKRSVHAGVKVCPSESVRRARHGGHRNEGEPMALAPRAAQ